MLGLASPGREVFAICGLGIWVDNLRGREGVRLLGVVSAFLGLCGLMAATLDFSHAMQVLLSAGHDLLM
jgi:hypothetical protein